MDTIDDYLGQFDDQTRAVLETIRRVLHEAVPGSGETLSYHLPTLTLDGRRYVHFAGWKRHVSLYPVPQGDAEFTALMESYLAGQGTLKFPLRQPIPYELIAQVGVRLARGLDRTTTAPRVGEAVADSHRSSRGVERR